MTNPLQQMLFMAKNGADPRQYLIQMAKNDPQAAQAARMLQGKTPAQLQQMALNMCRECGTTPEAIIQSLMGQGGVI